MKLFVRSIFCWLFVTITIFLGRLIVRESIERGVITFIKRRLPVFSTKYTTVPAKVASETDEAKPSGKYTSWIKLCPSSETVVFKLNTYFYWQVLSVVEQFLHIVRPVTVSTLVE